MYEIYLHLAVGMAFSLRYTNYGTLGWPLGGYRYSPSQPPTRLPIPRVHPPTPGTLRPGCPACYRGPNDAVGLKSVEQLTLDGQISDIRGITEVYNLRIARNPNDHNLIPGTD